MSSKRGFTVISKHLCVLAELVTLLMHEEDSSKGRGMKLDDHRLASMMVHSINHTS